MPYHAEARPYRDLTPLVPPSCPLCHPPPGCLPRAGTCPFSTSCFYRHAFPDGRLEDASGSLRKAADEEGHIRVVQPVRLSDFIAISTSGQRLGGGRRGR